MSYGNSADYQESLASICDMKSDNVNTKKKLHQTAIERLQTSIYNIRQDRWVGSVHVREAALLVYTEAKELDNRLLEAEALLQLGVAFAPMVFPEEAFKFLLHAENIFLINDLPLKVAECRVVAARALFDMGQHRDAIAYARSALKVSNLSVEYQAAAFVVAALSQGHLGELKDALQLIADRALPLSEMPGAHMVRPQVLRAAAALRLQLLISRKAPELWRGLPNLPSIHIDSPTTQEILAFVDAGKRAMPAGKSWGILEMAQLVVEGLSSTSQYPVMALETWVDITRADDPPTACWALFCMAIILQFRGDLNKALRCLQRALVLARRWELTLAIGDILLQKARIREALGDTAISLQSYKEFWGMRVKSMRQEVQLRAIDDQSDAACALEATDDINTLRGVEPACVSSATKYVAQNLSRKLTVSDVAGQCGVSRRTLEVAFKSARATTVAQYIRRTRLEQAAEALRATNCGVREIARSVGYATSAAFSRDFLVHFGAKPTAWRRQGS